MPEMVMPEMLIPEMARSEPASQPDVSSLGSQVLVCRDAGDNLFADDRQAPCADCGRALSYRPYLPEDEPKLCTACFAARKSSRLAN